MIRGWAGCEVWKLFVFMGGAKRNSGYGGCKGKEWLGVNSDNLFRDMWVELCDKKS